MNNLSKNLHRTYMKFIVNIRKPLKILKNHRTKYSLKLSHVTLYSAGNAGDTALSTAIRDLFNLNFEKISWKLKKVTARVNDKYIQDLNSTDGVVIGGGGLFLPDANKNDISNWEFACSENQYDEIKKPIILFAIGYNDFRGQKRSNLFESNVKKLVEKSSFFGLRNNGSVREIQSFLDDDKLRKKVVYQPCPTMVARYIYPDIPPKKTTGNVAFNVALDRLTLRLGDKAELILDQIAKAMYKISQKGYKVYFATHMYPEISFLKYLKKYPFPYEFCDISTWDMKKIMRFYNDMDIVIGMRGHGIWIPFGVNCQIISLGNQNKTKWFLEDIDALDWYIDITSNPNTLCEQIIDKFTEIHELNDVETNKRLVEAQKKLWNITCQNMKTIQKILS